MVVVRAELLVTSPSRLSALLLSCCDSFVSDSFHLARKLVFSDGSLVSIPYGLLSSFCFVLNLFLETLSETI
jgi:hypothetical protein